MSKHKCCQGPWCRLCEQGVLAVDGFRFGENHVDIVDWMCWNQNDDKATRTNPSLTITSLILTDLVVRPCRCCRSSAPNKTEQASIRNGVTSTVKTPSVPTSSSSLLLLYSTIDNACRIMYEESPVASRQGKSCFVSHNFSTTIRKPQQPEWSVPEPILYWQKQ